MSKIHVTEHALNRWAERFGATKMSEDAVLARANKIRKVVLYGRTVKPKEGLMTYLRNKCKDVEYLNYRNVVAVVENNRVITVYPYERDNYV